MGDPRGGVALGGGEQGGEAARVALQRVASKRPAHHKHRIARLLALHPPRRRELSALLRALPERRGGGA